MNKQAQRMADVIRGVAVEYGSIDPEQIRAVVALCDLETKQQSLSVRACNVGLSDAMERRMDRLEAQAAAIVAEHFPGARLETNRDPRGCMFRLVGGRRGEYGVGFYA